jgi:lipopolysaccharide export system protein LptC
MLKFSADTSRAETDDAVNIRVGDWRFDAVGLRTDLKDDTLRLESEVHGIFAPQ